ncbi:MAG: DUF3726 domain-containing protein [Pseudomonadota bacterium]
MVLQQLDLSLGEAEALITKAARGAGYPWGVAAEAGAAARNLIASGAEGARIFADVLEHAAKTMPPEHKCPIRRGLYRADGGTPDGPVTDAAVEAAFLPMPACKTRCDLDAETFERLNQLAARTYAPITEESRQRGAG